MITGYDHFVQLAGTLQWDETDIDFAADREAWPKLDETEQEKVLGLLAGFVIAETAVAGNLGNYQAAARRRTRSRWRPRSSAQARDEARHARFFDLVASTVVGHPGRRHRDSGGTTCATRSADELVDLFEETLPATAQRLADDHEGLTDAVGLYHMVIEGVVLLAGQHAMLDTLEKLSSNLPGLRKGMELVLRDERWHIGFGSRVIQNANISDEKAAEMLAHGESATKAWGDLITTDAIATAMKQHKRRLTALGIKFWSDA